MGQPEVPEPHISDEAFSAMLRQFFPEGHQPTVEEFRKLADVCQVSRPTLMRWWNGRNLPYKGVRAGLPRALAAFKRGEWKF